MSAMETGEKKKVILCEVYSRIIGYYRPVNAWNKSKQQEFKERKTYDSSLKKYNI